MSLLLTFLLLLQATPTGVVTGVIRTPAGVPQADVRVYAIALRDAVEATTGLTVYEGLTQTDAAGQYRLEVPVGRYIIAGGSVAAPVYYPGTTDATVARPIKVAAGVVLDKVDFSGVNAAQYGGLGIYSISFGSPPAPPLVTTVSGKVRLQDGSPAKGIEVLAVLLPRSTSLDVSPRNIPAAAVFRERTNEQGIFRMANIVQGDYYVISGTRDAPSIYSSTGPGTADRAQATRLTLTSPTDLKDISVPGVTLAGRVTTVGGIPGLGVRVRVSSDAARVGPAGLPTFLSEAPVWETVVDGLDGTYSVGGLSPGSYDIEALVTGASFQMQNVTVGSQPVNGIDISLPVAVISGKILYDDGSPVNDPRSLGNIVLLGSNGSTLVQLSGAGTFSAVMEPGEYRVGLPSLPGSQGISSMAGGGRDLLKQSLKVMSTESINIEIRVAK